MQNILIVVDMQNDFVDGSLGTPEARRIVGHVVEKAAGFDGRVLFRQDTHRGDYLETQEGKNLPVKHCIQGTEGWKLVPEVEALREEPAVLKETFGSSDLVEILKELDAQDPIRSIEFVGLCTISA